MDIGKPIEEGVQEAPSLVPEPAEIPDTPAPEPQEAPVETPAEEPVKV
jgi:hypothetical protein